ncbi:ABC transporter cdr4 [Phlyctema vagabunda]|uniref:ABC transporter cdr4 n=1 Tax=Phlyctema vagabunda TaxID=108571 RepID=A0ABR4P649_9HELO
MSSSNSLFTTVYRSTSSDVSSTDRDPSGIAIETGEAAEHKETSNIPPPDGERIVTELARKITRQSTRTSAFKEGHNPLAPEPDSSLDPNSKNFKPQKWIRSLVDLQAQEPDKFIRRRAGIAFKNLNAYGYGKSTDYQKTVGNIFFEAAGLVRRLFGIDGKRRIDILRNLDGIVESGEMLVVLGPPGSGCSTFLKTIAGDTNGYEIDPESYINYQGISAKRMHNDFRGEAIYSSEVDVHFPMLSVGDTLYFAARARAPRFIPGNVSCETYAYLLRDVMMAMFGIGHTVNTRVGSDVVRGVSGGERKRVSICEATLSSSPLQCWDKSTRGLDSANAIEFCKTLRTSADLVESTSAVAIYQAPESAYKYFDKVIVLYEGRQIYFGHTNEAKDYFISIGFRCPDRQTTPDFLTSMTSPQERLIRPGFETKAPRTSDEFAAVWRNSISYAQLMREIDAYDKNYRMDGEHLQKFQQSRRLQQAKRQRLKSPYTLTYSQQVRLCLWRGIRRLVGDPSLTLSQLIGNFIMTLIIGSVFYNLKPDTGSFFGRGSLIFFALLVNAFASALEILTLYEQRPIVEKHARYAFYHPSAEAFASMLTDIPYKVLNAITFNLPLYFMANLNRAPGPFFFFLFLSFFLTLGMSMMFRTIAAMSRTIAQAMVPSGVFILAIVIYTGFVIPAQYMLRWAEWLRRVNVLSYVFEGLMVNEFTGRNFTCSSFVPSGPGYEDVEPMQKTCSSVGSITGQDFVTGQAFIEASYGYKASHKWMNFGIIISLILIFMTMYLVATEYISAKKSKGEVLVFRRGQMPKALEEKGSGDIESGEASVGTFDDKKNQKSVIQRQTSIFHWQGVCYDIKIKGEPRRILDHVDGWVKPGTLTALMGVSGAGKTTLLDCLATRVTMGVITGDMLVDGYRRDASFQRKTGYVQQQDLHLSTTTVREALNFSALLRQPHEVPRQEKLDYVNEVIKLLDMEEYADAVVGVPGEGLNVEQRKRLTIGVELAAKPQLLLFLDEPTSGLDSQTSWAICDLLEKLKNHGQAILCTIHQPSAVLFQRFDRLLFLAKGGKTIYFGDIGANSQILIDYFERNGAPRCSQQANPAEWILEVIGAAPGTVTAVDWHRVWRESSEMVAVHKELHRLRTQVDAAITRETRKSEISEFAAPLSIQLREVTWRVFQQYYRSVSYIYSKVLLCVLSGLFIGFSFFKSQNTKQGLQNQMFSIFMILAIFGQLVEQSMPFFVTQRALYEVRERPSKAYSWKAFMLANIIVEIPWNAIAALLMWISWYYPVGLYENAKVTGSVTEKGALMFLLVLSFLLFTCTFSSMVIAGIENADNGGVIANMIFSVCYIFCGVLVRVESLPGFWVFMYRVSPFTYLVSGMLSVGVAGTTVTCASNEYLNFQPPTDQTCKQYMAAYIERTGGYLQNPDASENCSFCTLATTDKYLEGVRAPFTEAWRNFAIMWAYIVFNIAAALFLYWLIRVPKPKKEKEKDE